jgi:hypothetical protein
MAHRQQRELSAAESVERRLGTFANAGLREDDLACSFCRSIQPLEARAKLSEDDLGLRIHHRAIREMFQPRGFIGMTTSVPRGAACSRWTSAPQCWSI